MVVLTGVTGVLAAAALGAYVAFVANSHFVHDACDRIEATLNTNIVGQPHGIQAISDRICKQIDKEYPNGPLIISVHGPPCVGKTYSHFLVANALYGLGGGKDDWQLSSLKYLHSMKHKYQKQFPLIQDISSFAENIMGNPLACPGRGCPGYKVFYGNDYIGLERQSQHEYILDGILKHAKSYKESLYVLEEFDKAHPDTKAMLRQLLNHPEVANISLKSAIFILENNDGLFVIQDVLLKESAKRDTLSIVEVHRMLKEHMIRRWQKTDGGNALDATRFGNLIDYYIAYFPLERSHIEMLIKTNLQAARKELKRGMLLWTQTFADFCLKAVSFDGAFAIDGAKDSVLVLSYAHHSLRQATEHESAKQCPDDQLKFLLDVKDNSAVVSVKCAGVEVFHC